MIIIYNMYIYIIYIYMYITLYVGFWMVSECFGSICSWRWSKAKNSGGTTWRCDLGIFSEAMFRWFLLGRGRWNLPRYHVYPASTLTIHHSWGAIQEHHWLIPFLDMHGMYRTIQFGAISCTIFTWCLFWKDPVRIVFPLWNCASTASKS